MLPVSDHTNEKAKLARGLTTSPNVRLIDVSILEGSWEFNKVLYNHPIKFSGVI